MAGELTGEMVRIMRAVERGAFGMNAAGRYVIAGDLRPDRRSRELLQKRGLIGWRYDSSVDGEYVWFVTDKGRERLAGVDGGA